MASFKQYAGSKAVSSSLPANFDRLTVKQHEVFELIAEGRTTKEIAWRLDVTDSAINQRIEAVRSRVGSPPRAELARAYRRYLATKAIATVHDQAAPGSSGEPRHHVIGAAQIRAGDEGGAREAHDANRTASAHHHQWIVPPAFAGPHAGLNRGAAMAVIAAGLSAAALMGLSVVQSLDVLL